MTGIDRAALIDAVERARCAHMVSMADYRVCVCGARMDARHQSSAIVDAVLPLITQGIEQQVDVPRYETTYEDGAHDQRELILSWLRSLSQDGGNPT